ncbi:hypothetical protein KM043_012553 [Ampulex compressa]|nr:hypothetical protein KM043_012553 [Ampulex compressa]
MEPVETRTSEVGTWKVMERCNEQTPRNLANGFPPPPLDIVGTAFGNGKKLTLLRVLTRRVARASYIRRIASPPFNQRTPASDSLSKRKLRAERLK